MSIKANQDEVNAQTKVLDARKKKYPKSKSVIIYADTGLVQIATDWDASEDLMK